jgi:uncharacterized protein
MTMPDASHTNRLIHSTSPYLLQHAHNPVDWYPWGDEAIARAAREDKPIFLSIGYSSCHWCHVMERESYEDEAVAAVLAEHFIAVKVDREERPDLDEIYMTAIQAMSGRGGWPLNVFLMPDLKPFYGGTYYPPEDRAGMPSFRRVLLSVAEAYRTRRPEIDRAGADLVAAIRRAAAPEPVPGAALGLDLISAAARELSGSFDPDWGGFTAAPKFPQPTALRLLLAHHERTGRQDALMMATTTLDRMAAGGMYDQLGGGWHRYSVDERWLVPHFEKMLYDNALLATTYVEAYQLTGRPLYARVARETLDYLLREMLDARGGFHSAQDADTDGEEGKFYVWTADEVKSVLGGGGGDDAELFCRYYDVTPEGNFDGRNVLHAAVPPEEFAPRFKLTPEAWEARLAGMRKAMLAARSRRTAPGKDDKVLTDWTALAISALAAGWQVLGDPAYRDAAERAARFILGGMTGQGGLLHAHRAGRSHTPAFLDDYAFLAAALVDLYEATFDPAWIEEALRITDQMRDRFWDGEAGGFFESQAGQADLIVRLKRGYDAAVPCAGGVAARTLLRLAHLADRRDYAGAAEATLRAFRRQMEQAPAAAASLLLALDLHVGPVQEIAIVGPCDGPDTRRLLAAVRRRFLPRRVLASADPQSPDASRCVAAVPLLKDRPAVGGHAAAYVCENYACRRPVASVEELEELLSAGPEL